MSTFAFLMLCAQACLVQNVYGQCLRGAELLTPAYAGLAGPCGLGAPYGLDLLGPAIAGPLGFAPAAIGAYGAAYGGEGIGDVAVAGEMPVAGTTVVAGHVPIMGAVEFGGIVPAAGGVSIAGSCGCGCRGGYLY